MSSASWKGRWHLSPDPQQVPGNTGTVVCEGWPPTSRQETLSIGLGQGIRREGLQAPGVLHGPAPFRSGLPPIKETFLLERCNAKCTIKSVIQGEESNARTLGESSGACARKIDSREEASSLPAKGRTMASPGESGDRFRCSTNRPGTPWSHCREQPIGKVPG